MYILKVGSPRVAAIVFQASVSPSKLTIVVRYRQESLVQALRDSIREAIIRGDMHCVLLR